MGVRGGGEGRVVSLALLHSGKWLERVTLWAGRDVSRESPAEIKGDGGRRRIQFA